MTDIEATAAAPPPEAPELAPAIPDTTPAKTTTPTATAAADPLDASKGASQEADNARASKGALQGADKDGAARTATSESSTPMQQLWQAAKISGHPEIWGVTLGDPASHVPSQIVLQKYLNANDGDLAKAKDQLVKTLEWRAKMKPLGLLKKTFNLAKFGGLGYVTNYVEGVNATVDPEHREVFTWNIYGGVKSIDDTFGKLEEFIEWRVALMELALAELSISTATEPITVEHDPYKIFQVHDYKSISFLRQSAQVKAASTETIKVLAQNYPELLKEKFFVNVPAIMGFLYGFIKLFVAPKTVKKFHPMANGANLAREFGDSKVKDLVEKLPADYGGKGPELKAQGKESVLE